MRVTPESRHQYLLNYMKQVYHIVSIILIFCFWTPGNGQSVVIHQPSPGAFPIVTSTTTARIVFDAADDLLIQKVARLFQDDIEKVTGKKIAADTIFASETIILIGTIHRSRLLQQLVQQGKLDVSRLKNKREAYQVNIIQAPFKGVKHALVIAGSDRRGTAYGVLELSKQIGVSPWYWWADVPVKKHKEIYIQKATLYDVPKIQYRGIFINDE